MKKKLQFITLMFSIYSAEYIFPSTKQKNPQNATIQNTINISPSSKHPLPKLNVYIYKPSITYQSGKYKIQEKTAILNYNVIVPGRFGLSFNSPISQSFKNIIEIPDYTVNQIDIPKNLQLFATYTNPANNELINLYGQFVNQTPLIQIF